MYENNNGMGYTQPQTNYSAAMNDPQVDSCVENAFGKGLAATIMAWFPIASIIAIIFGNKAQEMVESAKIMAAQRGVNISGKNIAAKVLGTIGKIGGIVMTVFWGIYLFIIFAVIMAAL